MNECFRYNDDLGPTKIVHIYDPCIGLKGILVVDNVATGPSIGGLRMAPDVSLEECFRLARAMTLKNAAAELQHGGGKSVLFGDPAMAPEQKEKLIRAFACALGDIQDYIFGPDMGTNEVCMAWVKDEIGRAVGLPREMGGIPLDELGATGFGMASATDVAIQYCDFKISGARIAVQGFGSVGKHAARFLAEKGAVLVAAADSRGLITNPDGMDVNELIAFKDAGNPLSEFPNGKAGKRDDIVGVDCDIWIPAARPDVINESNVDQLKARLIVSGANISITEKAEKILHQNGILSIPDFIANAGGVICAAMEYHGTTQTVAFDAIAEKITRNTELVLKISKKENVTPREAAVSMAKERVKKAMHYRRWSVF